MYGGHYFLIKKLFSAVGVWNKHNYNFLVKRVDDT